MFKKCIWKDKDDYITKWCRCTSCKNVYYINTIKVDLVDGDWYYFDATGRLLQSTITPDGYTVDHEGKMISI